MIRARREENHREGRLSPRNVLKPMYPRSPRRFGDRRAVQVLDAFAQARSTGSSRARRSPACSRGPSPAQPGSGNDRAHRRRCRRGHSPPSIRHRARGKARSRSLAVRSPARRLGARPPAPPPRHDAVPTRSPGSDPEVDEVVVTRRSLHPEASARVLGLCPRFDERRRAHRARQRREQPPAAREKRVRLEVRDAPAIVAECRRGSSAGIDEVALEDDGSVTRARQRERGRRPATPPPTTTIFTPNANITGDPASGQPVGSTPAGRRARRTAARPGQIDPTRAGGK